MGINITLMDLNLTLQEVVGLLNSDAVIRDIRISCELTPELPLVRGDRIQLQQVALNLILKAFEAMNEQPRGDCRVMIWTCSKDSQILAAGADTGKGISMGEVEAVFKPFWTTKPQGLGLGLATSRSIINRHQGRVWAESCLDGGATFYFSLPVSTDEQVLSRG